MANEKMERLNEAKKRVEELGRTKERLSGVLETRTARVEELEKKARDDFDCEVSDIPDLVEKLDAEATQALEKAERLLGKEPAEEEAEEEAEDDDDDAII